jgi:hypothetical protein
MRNRILLIFVPVLLLACGGLTRDEARQALEEVEISGQAAALTSSSVEIATNFTIGDAAANAADELRTFIESQLPCAEITLSGTTLTVVYGARAGGCTYKGHQYSGTHQVSVMKNDMAEVIVSHTWTDFQNQFVNVNGTATVTWNFADQTRHVVHEATWTRLSDGRTGTGSGDRLQSVLEGGILTGFRVDGMRRWEGQSGTWDLSIDGVEIRWVDPVPQAGTYELDTPFGKTVSLSFERVNSTAIQVTIDGGRKEYQFNVVTLPDV